MSNGASANRPPIPRELREAVLARGEALRLPPRLERGETEELQFRLA